jgi:GAF domain-containing protein
MDFPADDPVRDLARVPLRGRELSEILGDITRIARRAVPGAEATSITLVRDDRGFTAAHDGQLALDADELQYQRGYGPCLDAGRTGLSMFVRDMRTESRWPDYAAAVVPKGVVSSLSVPLPFQGATIGALNTYATKVDAFDADSLRHGEEVASFIAVAVANAESYAASAELAHQMQEAMASRSVIDMAKGMLIAQNRCTPDEAFTILSRASQRSNRKLRDIAAAMVEGNGGTRSADQR